MDAKDREILFVHDLWLPAEFKPANQDGEVSEIRSMAVEDVLQNILAGAFTLMQAPGAAP